MTGVRSPTERGSAQLGTRDDAGTPGRWTLLLALLGGATAWSLHLLVSYVVLAWGCRTGWGWTRPALLAISALALAVTAWSGIVARRRWLVAREVDRPADDSWDARMGERTARVSFVMVVGLVLAIVFALGILYEAVTVFLAPLCEAGVGS